MPFLFIALGDSLLAKVSKQRDTASKHEDDGKSKHQSLDNYNKSLKF